MYLESAVEHAATFKNKIWKQQIHAKDIPSRYNSHYRYMHLAFDESRLYLIYFLDEINLYFKIIMVKAFVKYNFQLV